MITVAVAGAAGKMGREVVKGIAQTPDLHLVGGIDLQQTGADCGEVAGIGRCDAPIVGSLADLPNRPEVLVDFTHPEAVKENCQRAIRARIRPVVGTTGMSPEEVRMLAGLCDKEQLGALVAPNFAIGAVLLMRFAAEASRYFEHAEILELHHNHKADAPSGTAIKTAELMRQARSHFEGSAVPEKVTISGARGGSFEDTGIRVHSIRLPGLVAHQEVIFGGLGQTLTLRHDSMSRECFIPGVVLAVRKVVELRGLVYGLEHIL